MNKIYKVVWSKAKHAPMSSLLKWQRATRKALREKR